VFEPVATTCPKCGLAVLSGKDAAGRLLVLDLSTPTYYPDAKDRVLRVVGNVRVEHAVVCRKRRRRKG
jgi:hypothetical protein